MRGLTQTIKNIDIHDKSRDLNAKRMIDVNGRSIEYNEKLSVRQNPLSMKERSSS